ncbi:hypothetical protein, partial [Methanoculleus sp.]|uniref:hypothetical protein n=1 Tax=Methanoculleus sp. TaxID=90427 RepID=UPI0025E77AF1
MTVKLNTMGFIKKAQGKHKNLDGSPKYNYSKTNYINSSKKVIITCKIHGDFEQVPANHLFGSQCPECAKLEKNNGKFNLSIFLEKSKQIHGDKYDYSKVIYNGTKNKVIIICPIHGEFEQIPESHFLGKGCPKCVGKNSDSEIFINKSKQIHGDKYDYSKTIYKSARDYVKIICKDHGEFNQIACNHLSGSGCPKCAINKNAKDRILTLSEFIEKANKVHNNKYDYSKTIYKSHREISIITCPIHGDFEQKINNHLSGAGCPTCANEKVISSYELELQDFIKSLNIDYVFQDRKILNGKELDIFIPSKKVAIEFNGLYWHS